MTYKDGSPILDQGRLWFTISVRGQYGGQGVFSLNPSVFDIRLEGIIVFDRDDGLLRNEIASHIFYDKEAQEWRGLTVGFSAKGDPYPDLKQLGELDMHRPPWNEGSNARCWPSVIPLPDGYPAPYIALSMDRANYANQIGWTYGALYFYHGHPKNGERELYEYHEREAPAGIPRKQAGISPNRTER